MLPHDWSLVAWSEKSPITIEHTDGFKSGSFRNLAADPSIPVPANFTEPPAPVEEPFVMDVRDYSLENDHIYDVQVENVAFGNFTERIRTNHEMLSQTLTLDHLNGTTSEMHFLINATDSEIRINASDSEKNLLEPFSISPGVEMDSALGGWRFDVR